MEIARNDPLWLSELIRRIKKKKDWSRGGVEKALHRLQEKNLIEVVRTAKTRSPVVQAWYDVTLRGLVVVLSDVSTWDHIDEIAKHKADKLPLVFGKWSYFVEKGAKDQLIAALSWAVDDPFVAFYVGTWNELPDSKRALGDRLTERVLFFSMDLTSGWSLDYQLPFSLKSVVFDADKWIRILIGDSDLKEYLERSLEHFTERFERNLEDIKLMRMILAKADRHR